MTTNRLPAGAVREIETAIAETVEPIAARILAEQFEAKTAIRNGAIVG